MATTTDTTFERRDLYDDMAVDIPEGTHGTCSVERFVIPERDIRNMLEFFHGGRQARPGTYTMLKRGENLWMSDTTAERYDHYDVASEINRRGGRILIAGLGLGMILRVALLTPTVAHIDVVEIDADVIALVGPHYQAMANERGIELVIHHADMYEIGWPKGTRWDVAWFDIWPNICEDNLDDMAKLARSYGKRADWKGYWSKDDLLRVRRQSRNGYWGWR